MVTVRSSMASSISPTTKEGNMTDEQTTPQDEKSFADRLDALRADLQVERDRETQNPAVADLYEAVDLAANLASRIQDENSGVPEPGETSPPVEAPPVVGDVPPPSPSTGDTPTDGPSVPSVSDDEAAEADELSRLRAENEQLKGRVAAAEGVGPAPPAPQV